MELKLYQFGNPWQRKVYSYLSEHLENMGIKEFGVSGNENTYRHLLRKEDGEKNFVNKWLYDLTYERFNQHKAGDLNRILTNTASSQAYCFNMFLYLNEHNALASRLFSELFGKAVEVQHIELEFTPNQMQVQPFGSDSLTPSKTFTDKRDESIGDQSEYAGTDADVAVFYTCEDGKKGILLIEFKFIEAEFSVCGSYKTKTATRQYCNSTSYYQSMIVGQQADNKQKPFCGYSRYLNWQLTKNSEVLDNEKVKHSAACPFRFGLNQLWRNMLLAERVAEVRQCDEFGFWVMSPLPNDAYLWKEKGSDVEQLFRAILTEKGNNSFRKVHLENIFARLDRLISTDEDKDWLEALKEKYMIRL